uniref:Chemosensory protein 3 n=1 Tax=Colaphellus bowringi TaxID=561076 RepID=A0A0S3J2N5_9CUCU|nr:chemosensory protein 3 [Colaphellus bowringi]
MKFSLMLCVLVALLVFADARPEDKYTTKYDKVDLDAILQNERLLRSYIDCLLDKKKCSKDGEELKKILPEALKSKCAKCNENQKKGAKKVIRYLLKEKRAWWDELEAVYDPEGIYRKTYEKELKEEGIQI